MAHTRAVQTAMCPQGVGSQSENPRPESVCTCMGVLRMLVCSCVMYALVCMCVLCTHVCVVEARVCMACVCECAFA